VIPGQWGIGEDQQLLELHGYVGLDSSTNVNTSTGSVAGVTIAFPRATALFYGSVNDNQNNPLPRVRLSGENGNNGNGIYQADGTTDQNGSYVIGVVAGIWGVHVGNSDNKARYG